MKQCRRRLWICLSGFESLPPSHCFQTFRGGLGAAFSCADRAPTHSHTAALSRSRNISLWQPDAPEGVCGVALDRPLELYYRLEAFEAILLSGEIGAQDFEHDGAAVQPRVLGQVGRPHPSPCLGVSGFRGGRVLRPGPSVLHCETPIRRSRSGKRGSLRIGSNTGSSL